MKKLIAAASAAVLFLSAAACSEENDSPKIKLETERDCIINYKGNEYSCTLSFLSDEVEAVTLKSPETLSGLSFRYSDGKYTVSLGSLICRSDSILLPDNSFPAAVSDIMHDIKKNKDNIQLIKEKNGYSYSPSLGTPCTVRTDQNGSITEISLGNK